MNTSEMIINAYRTDKTYVCKDLFFNMKRGFIDENGEPWPGRAFENLNDFFNLKDWKEVKKMTQKEIEKVLGYKIQIID